MSQNLSTTNADTKTYTFNRMQVKNGYFPISQNALCAKDIDSQ